MMEQENQKSKEWKQQSHGMHFVGMKKALNKEARDNEEGLLTGFPTRRTGELLPFGVCLSVY